MVKCSSCKKENISKFTSCECCINIICIPCRNKNKPKPPFDDITNICDDCKKEWE